MQEGFVIVQPLGKGALGNKRRDIDADGIGGNGAQDEVFLGTAFELDMNGEAV